MKIDFSKTTDELVPVIVQEYNTLKVLMLGYMNQAAYEKTQKENRVTFFSRSKNRLWTKGETSGNYLEINNILVDCDQDSVIYKVTKKGNGACHTYNMDGKHRKSCFYRSLDLNDADDLKFIED